MTPPRSDGSADRIVVQVDSAIEDLVPPFLGNRRADVDTIRDALRRGDMGTIQMLGHSMKGSGGAYGFDPITEIGAALEHAAQIGDRSEIERRIADLSDYLSRLDVVYV